MEVRSVGNSGLRISSVGFGAMTFGGKNNSYAGLGSSDGSEASRIIGKCIDAGVTFFDTANSYSEGRSEEVLGEALGKRRSEVVVSTKAYNRIGRGPNDLGASRSYLIRACEESLRRLNTDYIDLYQLHNYDGLTPQEETLAALDNLVASGKVRYTGVSNYSGWHLMKALSIADRKGINRYVSQQANYSLLNREIESELVALALEEQIGIIVYSPLQNGLLTGKYHQGGPVSEATRTQGYLPDGEEGERLSLIVETLLDIGQTRGVSAGQAAINWLLGRPGVTTVMIGARNEQQLEENLGAVGWSLTEEERARLDKVSEVQWRYPYSAYNQYAGERNPYYMRGESFTQLMPGPWDRDARA